VSEKKKACSDSECSKKYCEGCERKMYKAQDGSVADNIVKFKDGKLSLLTEIHSGFHNHGGKNS